MKMRLFGQVLSSIFMLAILICGFAPAQASPAKGNMPLEQTLPNTWSPLGTGTDDMVYAITISGSDVYVGGAFHSAGNCTDGCYHIAKWDGSNWSAVGGGTFGDVYAIVVRGSSVYVGGEFNRAGDCTSGDGCNYIAKWNGSTWSALGTGMDSAVRAVAVSNTGIVYAGGDFQRAGTCTKLMGCDRIAKWNGSIWQDVGGGVDPSSLLGGGNVSSLAFFGTSLYAGGYFPRIGGCNTGDGCIGIAKWDGSLWANVEGGMNDSVLALAVDGSSLYAVGYFTKAGNCTSTHGCSHIARWDGANWSALGTGLPGVYPVTIRAVSGLGGEVYAGGTFSTAGNCTNGCNNIAWWDGSAWQALNTGVIGDVWAVAATGSSLYAGGTFNGAGACTPGEGCNNIATFANIVADSKHIYLPLVRR